MRFICGAYKSYLWNIQALFVEHTSLICGTYKSYSQTFNSSCKIGQGEKYQISGQFLELILTDFQIIHLTYEFTSIISDVGPISVRLYTTTGQV